MNETASAGYGLYVLFMLIIDVMLIYKLSRTPGFGREESWTIRLVIAVAITALADVLCVNVGAAAGFWGNYLFNFVFDLAAGYIAYFFFCYCGMRFSSRVVTDRRWFRIFSIPMMLLVVVLVASLWTGWVFHIAPDGAYERGPLFVIFVFVLANGYTIGALILSVVGYLRERTRARRRMLADCVKYVAPLAVGTILQFFVNIVPSSNMGMTLCILFIFMDNQERLLYRRTLDAEAANAAKSEFLSRMSHDVRTPINGIIGMIEIARANVDNAERVGDCLDKMGGAANQLLSMVSDVLDMSKIESEGLDLTYEPFDLLDMIHDVDKLHQTLAIDRGIEVRSINEDALVHHRLMGSPSHVRSLLVNLVSNGVKYTDRGGVVTGSIREIPLEEAAQIRGLKLSEKTSVVVEFTVSDTGIGMSKEFAKHVFDPFTQERNDGRTTYKGSGLGLAIVKKIVDGMGGVIMVDTELGHGSTFTVLLPFECADEDAYIPATGDAAQVSAVVQASVPSIAGMRVLVVEDNELNREIAEYALEESGAEVTCAADGQEAFDLFCAKPVGTFDAVLMDVMMPRMDGLEATRRIRLLKRTDAKTVPIIGMSANAFADDITAAKQAGMNDYVLKPVNAECLLKALVAAGASQCDSSRSDS